VLPVKILREAVESYAPYLQASGEMYVLEPGEELALDYRVVLGNGPWPRARIEDYVDVIYAHPGKES